MKKYNPCKKLTIKKFFLLKIIDLQVLNAYAVNMKKTFILYPIIFITTAMACMVFLMGTALIPQEAVYDNAKQSAVYFQEAPLFEYCVGELENFRRDNYADCISTSIAYHFGEGSIYEAVIRSDFNHVSGENVNDSFYREVEGEEVETEPYSRYWHGSAGVIRLLLTVMDIQTIRYVITAVGIILNAGLVIALMRKQQKALGVIYTFAFLLVNGMFALGCLEYGFVFLLVPVAGLLFLTEKWRNNFTKISLTFLVIGTLTAFFDFLTTETLTFTVPFVIYYIAVYRTNASAKEPDSGKEKRKAWLVFLKSGLCWCAGYAGMFLCKWFLATGLLGKDALLTTYDSVKERISGDVNVVTDSLKETATLTERLQGLFIRNLGCLYWGDNDMKVTTVLLITFIIVALLAGFWYMTRKEYKKDGLGILIAVSMVPYVRFLLLSNHSYIHYFFTYRAQMVTIMVILYIIYDTTVLSERIKRRK